MKDQGNIFIEKVHPLTEAQSDRAMKIIADFVAWHPETTGGPMPFSISSIWFKRVCAMAEKIARLELP